jgi:hypothetical protein
MAFAVDCCYDTIRHRRKKYGTQRRSYRNRVSHREKLKQHGDTAAGGCPCGPRICYSQQVAGGGGEVEQGVRDYGHTPALLYRELL